MTSDLVSFDLGIAAECFIRLGVAFLLTLPVALNREKAGKPLGLRTFPLVAVAATAYVMIGKVAFADDAGAQARIIQGLITGIGFLGGGAILKQGMSVSGTATAASIWSTAALGAAVAYSRFEIALVLAFVNFFVLRSLEGLSEGVSGGVERLEEALEEVVEERQSD